MAQTRISGSDGSVTLPAATHEAVIRSFDLGFAYATANVTGFEDSVQRNRIGMPALSGTMTGVPTYDAASTGPGFLDAVAGGSSVTWLFVTGCSIAATAGVNDIRGSSDAEGDATLVYSFVNGDSDTITETWDETP